MRPGEALSLVGLESRMHNFFAQLSGGEQQRVVASPARSQKCPTVRLCDEPSAPDSKTEIPVIDALLGVNREPGTTTVIITRNATVLRPSYPQSGSVLLSRRNSEQAADHGPPLPCHGVFEAKARAAGDREHCDGRGQGKRGERGQTLADGASHRHDSARAHQKRAEHVTLQLARIVARFPTKSPGEQRCHEGAQDDACDRADRKVSPRPRKVPM